MVTWCNLQKISSLPHVVGRIGQIRGSHRVVRHQPQCTTMTDGKICKSASFTKSWLEQAAKEESVNLLKSDRQVQVYSSEAQEASTPQTSPFTTRVPGMLALNGKVFTLRSTSRNRENQNATTIIIFKQVTKPNTVEFVLWDLKLAKMEFARVVRRQIVRQNGKEWPLEKAVFKGNVWVQILCLVLCQFMLFLVVSRPDKSNRLDRDGVCRHDTYLYSRLRIFFSCAHHSAGSLIDSHSSSVVLWALAQGI